MGEIADMLLDGTLCEWCGVYMGESWGYPVRCADCRRTETKAPPSLKVKCPHCAKTVKACGLGDHIKAKHP